MTPVRKGWSQSLVVKRIIAYRLAVESQHVSHAGFARTSLFGYRVKYISTKQNKAVDLSIGKKR
jgi:hypothetical protein